MTGLGTIDGRKVAIFSQDFTVFGGSLGEAFAEKMVKIMDLAERYGCPIIGINDSAGARIQEGVEGLAGYGEVFYRNVRLSGVVPQISIIAGPCAGGAVYSPAMTDFVDHGRGRRPDVHHRPGRHQDRHRRGRSRTRSSGGADAHMPRSAAWPISSPPTRTRSTTRSAICWRFLPSNNLEDPPASLPTTTGAGIAPRLEHARAREQRRGRTTCTRSCRACSTMASSSRSRPRYAGEHPDRLRPARRRVGRDRRQPAARCWPARSTSTPATKAARFVRFCDAFNVPLIVFEDVPGFLPGTDQEYGGIIRHGSKLLYAFAEATVPKITVITRKAYGGAYVVMNSKSHRRRLRLRLADRRDRRDGVRGGRALALPARPGCGR